MLGGWLAAEHSSAQSLCVPVAAAKAAFAVAAALVVAAVFAMVVAVAMTASGAPSCPPGPQARNADALWTAPTFSLVSRSGSACAAADGAKTESACRRAIAARRLRRYQRSARCGSTHNRQDFLDWAVYPEADHQSEGEGSKCACAGAHARGCAWRKREGRACVCSLQARPGGQEKEVENARIAWCVYAVPA